VFRVIRGSYSQNLNKTIHESHETHEGVPGLNCGNTNAVTTWSSLLRRYSRYRVLILT